MKKKTLYNLVMVAIIVAIVAGGVLGVGHIRGWFDRADGGPALVDIVGVVRMERAGVNYTVGRDTVLRPGDVISTQTGATASIAVGGNYVALGGSTELTVVNVENLEVHLTAGELFINAEDHVSVTFETELERLAAGYAVRLSADTTSEKELVRLDVTDATLAISYRQGAQTLSVFRGKVDDVSAGQTKEYMGGQTYISEIKVESLNSFMIAQIRKANKNVSLSVSNKELDELEEKRRQELENMIGGVTEPTIPAHEHNLEPTYVPATCTEAGYIEYRCSCGEGYQDNRIEAKGHSFGDWEVTKEATNEQEGLMERKCLNCDETEQQVIEKLSDAHVHHYKEEVVAPTCTEKGYTLFICACGDRYKDSETAATGHQYNSTVFPPLCTTQGYTLYTCACGASYMDDLLPATGHNWEDWKDAGNGFQKRSCVSCGETETQSAGGSSAPAPHVHNYTVTVVEATCTKGGYTEYNCACGARYQDQKTGAKGHSFADWEVKKVATESEEGLMERSCRNCEHREEKTIDKLVHSHSYAEQVVAPTCVEKGYTLHTCACGDSYKDNEVAATGKHNYEKKVVASTCTAQGYSLYTCACGESYMDDISPATGHSWGAWITVKEATENEEGQKERTCSACSTKEEAVIAKIDNQKYVYISIYCNTILNNMADLEPGKAEFVPSDGVILSPVKVAFTAGETVFHVLQRICAQMNIQMEYSWSPMYGTYYIEGINNLYEFDCGSQSGWMYKVNGWFPNYGVSAYELSEGDQIVFAYTCKGLGTDVGAPEWTGE